MPNDHASTDPRFAYWAAKFMPANSIEHAREVFEDIRRHREGQGNWAYFVETNGDDAVAAALAIIDGPPASDDPLNDNPTLDEFFGGTPFAPPVPGADVPGVDACTLAAFEESKRTLEQARATGGGLDAYDDWEIDHETADLVTITAPDGRTWTGIPERDIDPVMIHGLDPILVFGDPGPVCVHAPNASGYYEYPSASQAAMAAENPGVMRESFGGVWHEYDKGDDKTAATCAAKFDNVEPVFECGARVEITGGGPPYMDGMTGTIEGLSIRGLYTLSIDPEHGHGSTCRNAEHLCAIEPEPDTNAVRKGQPLFDGCLNYFPDALLAVAQLSRVANEQHNPGEPMHWSKGKSNKHADSLARHLLDHGTIDPSDGQRHSAHAAWRALALLQTEIENEREASE